MWAGQDNGSYVNWNQAKDYCANLRLGSYSNWRLATIEELEGIYDQTQNVKGNHIKGGIKLSAWIWSSSAGPYSGEAWNFNFGDGKRNSLMVASAALSALCVRRP